MLPVSELRNLAALLERFKTAPVPSGLYRIYYQEPGLPPQQVLEFRKTGNTIGDPVREPGRGANPAADQPAVQPEGAAAPADAETPDANQGALLPTPRPAQPLAGDSEVTSYRRAARQLRRWQVS
jgi:hypothetical protein